MLLAIDIGNTNINLGVFSDNRLLKRYIIPSRQKRYLRYLKPIFSGNKIEQAMICSVVPSATRIIAKNLRRFLCKAPCIIGKNTKIPIKNLYRNPNQVGQDRLINAYAGVKLYGAPLIVIDFGTAVTFDVISAKKEYLGGMILPGLQISLDCLGQRAALLPKIKLSAPQEFIGRDTNNSMLSGIVYGFAALTDDLIERIKAKIGRSSRVVGTGGNIDLIGSYCKSFNKIDKDLTLKGLNLLYETTSR